MMIKNKGYYLVQVLIARMDNSNIMQRFKEKSSNWTLFCLPWHMVFGVIKRVRT
jgi:hypothetical protein